MDHGTDEASVEVLAMRADWARAKLVRALGALDERRREALGTGEQLKEKLAIVAVVGAVVALGGAAFWLYRAATAASRRPHERALMLRRAWRHPDRVGQGESMVAAIAKALAATLATQAVKYALAHYETLRARATT